MENLDALQGTANTTEGYSENAYSVETASEAVTLDVERLKQIREKMRYERAVAVVGKELAIKSVADRPKFVITKQRRNPATGVIEQYEAIHCPALAQAIRSEEHYYFIRHPVSETISRYWYSGGVYRLISDTELRGYIKRKIEQWDPNLVKMRDIVEVFGLITTDLKYVSEEAKESARFVINFRNGLYDVLTGKLIPHTHEIFSTIQLPVDYPEDVKNVYTKSRTFEQFMRRFCYGPSGNRPGGTNRFQFLMEYMAVILSNLNGGKFKKSLWMVGPGDCGKSQFLSLITYLLGLENCHSSDMAQLEARFGTAPIYGKRLVFCPDQRFIKVPEVSVFKKITGDDSINIERKGKDSFTFRYDGLSWFCMNKLPHFGGDTGKHVYERIVVFQCPESVPKEEQDHNLLDKMKAEAPYIVTWILSYLPQVIKRGYRFHEPDEAEAERRKYAQENSDVETFLAECCVIVANPADADEEAIVQEWRRNPQKPTLNDIYSIYKIWCDQYENGYSLKRRDWKSKLCEIFDMTDKELAPHTNKGYIIQPFCLNREAASNYAQH